MPDEAPKGVLPLFLRGVTLEKFGLKNGDDLVDYKFIPKEDIMKEIQVMGVMSDFEPGKKMIEPYLGDQILILVDRTQKYGEATLLCYTNEARDEMLKDILEQQEALKEQLLAEQRAEEEKLAAELARKNIVYEDKPITPNPWVSTHSHETDQEIKQLSSSSARDLISIEIHRPKRFTKQAYKLNDRNSDVGGVAEFRATKDPNFRAIKETDRGIQVAPQCQSMAAQTTFYRSVNKAVQYESASVQSDSTSVADTLLAFLEKATVRIEQALQQNESVDIFLETNRLVGDEEGTEGAQVENELREVRNFADAVYSKSKVLPAIDWIPKTQGMVAVSAVRNVSFDQRIPILGQTHTSYILLWDFRVLVKPLVLLQSHHEIFTFRFNRADPTYIVGGCITGQVMLWEVTEAINNAQRRNNTSGGGNANSNSSPNGTAGNGISSLLGGMNGGEDDEEQALLPVMPLYVSSVDHSHKKCVADLFWLPPTTQINYRGQLVREEFLDGHSYQFITIAGDGMIMVWDIRYEKIFNDELRHIGRPKHVPTEKSSTKEGGGVKPLWGPIFKTHLKRLEGVGELSLCKICDITNSKLSQLGVGKKPNNFQGDSRSQFIIATEEGDIIFTDLSTRKDVAANNANKEEEEDDDNEVSCVKWMAMDHPRPSVHLQESPFFPQIVLSISDWNFHIWKLGESNPIFSSPISSSYLTAGCWSTTRPAVLFTACADGNILVWDFTDSSFHPSIELKAAHAKITSLELLASSNSRLQLLAVGDEVGTLHIFEMPRNLVKPVHREESIMLKFLERELLRVELLKSSDETTVAHSKELEHHAPHHQPPPTASSTTRGGGTTDSAANTEELSKAEQALLKEEEEFLKLESIFISELGLDTNQLPKFLAK